MENVGQNFAGHTDEPLKFFPDFRMYGKAKIAGTEVDLSNQQRTIKGFLAAKLSQGLRPRAAPLAREDRPSGAHPLPAAG